MKPSPRILLSLVCLAAIPGCKREVAAPTAYNVRTATAEILEVSPREQGPSFLGIIRGDTETALSFRVNGQIERIGPVGSAEDWKQGVVVKEGTELAQLDRSNFVNAVAAARARADLARANFARVSDLYGASNLSKSEFDASRAQKEMSEADLAQAEQYLSDATLRSPYDGVILNRVAKAGEFAAAGRPALIIGDFRRVSLEVGVPDTLLGQISVGQNYSVVVSAFEGEEFNAQISEIGIAADPNSRLFRVVLKIANPEGRLKSGMTASVRLGGRESHAIRGVLVPLSALVASSTAPGSTAVFIVDKGGSARLRAVKTTEIVGSSIVVVEGVSSGDRIVTLGAGQLTDGAPVNDKPMVK